MMKVIFSPCLYCRGNELFDLYLLNDTLNFIIKYLDGSLDDYEDAFYNDNRLFMPPVINNVTEMMQYTAITTNLYKLKLNGENINIINHKNSYQIDNFDLQVVDDTEFQKIIDYLQYLFLNNQSDDVLLFTDKVNDSYRNKNIEITIADIPHSIPIVGDPMLDESGNFDIYLKDITDETEIFKYKSICTQLVNEMNRQILNGQRNGNLYKKYGKIIALRNKFSIYFPIKPYDKDTIYFISSNQHDIVSIDLKHGHFEVFDNTNQKLWVAKYSMYGEEINRPTNLQILKNIRKDHKVEE